MAQRSMPTAWVGWVYFAGALMLTIGGLQIIAGLVALFKQDFYVVAQSGLVALNYTAWGWIHLILGIVMMLAAFGIWVGATWARLFAIFLTVLVMIDQLAFLSAYPLWSMIGLIMSGFILYALTMHGGELKIDS